MVFCGRHQQIVQLRNGLHYTYFAAYQDETFRLGRYVLVPGRYVLVPVTTRTETRTETDRESGFFFHHLSAGYRDYTRTLRPGTGPLPGRYVTYVLVPGG